MQGEKLMHIVAIDIFFTSSLLTLTLIFVQMGHFRFSALFHSYENPTSMCGRCVTGSDDVISCRDANRNGDLTCGLSFIYCLQPYNSPPLELVYLTQFYQTSLDSYTFEEGTFIQSSRYGLWKRTNPYTRDLLLWPVRLRFDSIF